MRLEDTKRTARSAAEQQYIGSQRTTAAVVYFTATKIIDRTWGSLIDVSANPYLDAYGARSLPLKVIQSTKHVVY